MKPANPSILTINGGSSSIKFALYQTDEHLKQWLYGKVDRIVLSISEMGHFSNRTLSLYHVAVTSS